MTLGGVAVRNVLRNKFRSGLTVAGVAVAILGFVLLRTILSAWTSAAEFSAKDRIGTRDRVSFVTPLPRRYADEIRALPGVKAATWASWVGAKLPGHEREFFATFAVDPPTYFQVYEEAVVPAEDRERFLHDRRGAVAGQALSKRYGWKVGDKAVISAPIYGQDLELVVDGIYRAARKSIDNSMLLIHWEYLNDSLPAAAQDKVGWVVTRVDDPTRTAEISAVIDRHFDDRDTQTLSMSERALNNSFLGGLSAVLRAIDLVSMVILVIMMLILGNTIAMGVRERTSEYAVLRAIGFLPWHLVTFVLGEAAAIGALGGGLGLLASYPLIEGLLGRWIEENFGSFFPYFRIADDTAAAAPVLAVALALVAAALPAYRASKLKVVDALRRLG